jgi:hypothetical protein
MHQQVMISAGDMSRFQMSPEVDMPTNESKDGEGAKLEAV